MTETDSRIRAAKEFLDNLLTEGNNAENAHEKVQEEFGDGVLTLNDCIEHSRSQNSLNRVLSEDISTVETARIDDSEQTTELGTAAEKAILDDLLVLFAHPNSEKHTTLRIIINDNAVHVRTSSRSILKFEDMDGKCKLIVSEERTETHKKNFVDLSHSVVLRLLKIKELGFEDLFIYAQHQPKFTKSYISFMNILCLYKDSIRSKSHIFAEIRHAKQYDCLKDLLKFTTSKCTCIFTSRKQQTVRNVAEAYSLAEKNGLHVHKVSFRMTFE